MSFQQRKVETNFIIIVEFVIACAEESATFVIVIGYSYCWLKWDEFV